jgi:ferredoxin
VNNKPVIEIQLDLCIGCGLCYEVCPFGLPVRNEFGRYDILQPERCTQCTACKRNCPVQAIVVEERTGCGCIWCPDTTDGSGNTCC